MTHTPLLRAIARGAQEATAWCVPPSYAVIPWFPSLYIMEGPATTQPPGEPDGNAVDEETEDSVSGVPAEVEDEIPTDLLADLIQVQDADMKPATRQDYARRVSRYS